MKGRVFYEIFVGSFNDSNGDGIGDLKGITQKLDYLKDLGIKGLWLTPIFDSPSYHGYDTTNYYKIKPEYGTLEDFKELLYEAYKRDIVVLLDLVLNHTSDKHEWFQKSSEYDNYYRDFYRWSNEPNNDRDATPMNTNPWSYRNGSHYFSSFWDGMPNLNHDNKKVREEVKNIVKYWLDIGVDGFRLDAVRWTFNDVDKCVEFWKWFRFAVDEIKPNVYLVGEAWDDPDVVSKYVRALGASFNFDLAWKIADRINWECVGQLKYDMADLHNKHYLGIDYRNDSIFLSNHDQDRIMSVLNNSKRNMQIASTLLLTLPGTPYIYYGEEIGMLGTKEHGDENVRKNFVWSAVDIGLELQSSLLNHYRTLIHLRNNEMALQKGIFAYIPSDDQKLLVYVRMYKNDEIMIIINQGEDTNINHYRRDSYNVLYSNCRVKGVIESNYNGIKIYSNEILILKRI